MSSPTMIPIQHRMSIRSAPIFQALHQFECGLRVAMPAIVVANPAGDPFNAELQTVSVQPAVQEVMRVNAVPTLTTLPILDDVPFVMPRAGGWGMTLPIAVGDECLVVFCDMAMDIWWQSGGVQKQPDGKLYRHDLWDGVAIFGISSNPKAIANYSTTSAQLRSDDGSVVIDLATGAVTITAAAIKALNTGGTPQKLMTDAFYQYWVTEVYPFLVSKGFAGGPAPVNSETTVLEAE